MNAATVSTPPRSVAGAGTVPSGGRKRWRLRESPQRGRLFHSGLPKLIAHVLGGAVDGGSLLALWRASEGIPLVLRELLLGAQEGGALVAERGVWRLRGAPMASGRLLELIDARAPTTPLWSWILAVAFVSSHSVLYELVEWGAAAVFGGELGIAYLGAQGDAWDAQKDMLLALAGSAFTATLLSRTSAPAARRA